MMRSVLVYFFGGALLVGLLIAYTLLALVPTGGKTLRLLREHTRTRQMLSEARAWSNNFDEFLSRASRLRIDLAQLNEHIPPEANIAEVLKQISRVATISNVSGMQFAPQPLEQRGELWVQPIELQISGSYHGVGRFVSELAKLPRIVVARKINLIGKEKTSQQQTLVAELLVETYVRNP